MSHSRPPYDRYGPYDPPPGPSEPPGPPGPSGPPDSAGEPSAPPQGYGAPPEPHGPPWQGPYGYGRPGRPGPYGERSGPYGERPGPYGEQRPSPYGEQPWQPGPYDPPGHPDPYAQRPGEANPYAPPPPPGRPGNGTTAKVVAVLAASLVLVGAIATGGILLAAGDDKGSPKADSKADSKAGSRAASKPRSESEAGGGGAARERRMRLTTPRTLADGAYTIEKDREALKKEGVPVGESQAGVEYVIARYKGDSAGASVLTIEGGYGRFGAPERTKAWMFGNLESSGGAEVVGARRTYRPAAAHGTEIECEVVKGRTIGYAPVCAWADSSTAAVVLYGDAGFRSLSDVDPARFADTTAAVRSEARVPE